MGYPQGVVPGAELVAEVSSGDGTELPHWADPPTGEVPRALAGPPGDDEMQAWRLLGSKGLHWRDDVNDWADSPGVEDLVEHEAPAGPAEESHPPDPFSFDEDFERLERERAIASSLPDAGEGIDEAPTDGSLVINVDDPEGVPLPPGPVTVHPANGTESRHEDEDATRAVVVSPAMGKPPRGPRMRTKLAAKSRRPEPGPSNGTAPSVGAVPGSKHIRRPYDVNAESGFSGGGRDVGAAAITGLGLIALFVICYVVGPGALLALSALALLGCALEAFSMLQRAGFRPATLLGALGTAGAVLAAYWRGPASISVVLVIVVVATLVWYLARVVEARPVVNVAVTLMGFVWVGVLGSFAGLLLQASKGEHLFLGAVVPTVAADLVAWFVGTRLGSHHLAPHISPGKTWEGVLGGGLAALIVGAIIGSQVAPWGGARHGLELGLLIAVVAPLGDLVQSMVKRDLRLKDSGALLPGHGGLLDRFDSLLFVLPATYYLATVLHLVH